MSKITVKSFDARGSLTGHSSGPSTGGEVVGHTPVPNSYTPDAVQPENQACCEDGGPAVALKRDEAAACEKSAPDSVFHGTAWRPSNLPELSNLPVRADFKPAPVAKAERGNTNSVLSTNPPATGDSVAFPGSGSRNTGNINKGFQGPGIPTKPGQPNY